MVSDLKVFAHFKITVNRNTYSSTIPVVRLSSIVLIIAHAWLIWLLFTNANRPKLKADNSFANSIFNNHINPGCLVYDFRRILAVHDDSALQQPWHGNLSTKMLVRATEQESSLAFFSWNGLDLQLIFSRHGSFLRVSYNMWYIAATIKNPQVTNGVSWNDCKTNLLV